MVVEAIQYVPLDKVVCEEQVRGPFADQEVIGLARSFQELGQLQPIRVRCVEERYITVDGARRVRAARLAKLPTIAAIVEEKDLTLGEVVHRQLVANLQRAGLTALQKARGIRHLIDETGWTAAEAASRCGFSNSSVTKLLAILEMPEAIQERIAAGEIPESAAYALKQADPARQAALAEQMAAGELTRDELAAEVKADREATSNRSRKGPRRATALLASGDSVTVIGADLTLPRIIAAIDVVQKKFRRLQARGLDLAGACRAIREEARAETAKQAEVASPAEEPTHDE